MSAASKPKTLQTEIDSIAEEFQASVVVSSRELQSWVASPQGPHIDEVRKKSLIERETPIDSRSWIESFDLDSRRVPFIMREKPELGLLARVCVPVRNGNAEAFIWMIPYDDHDTDGLLERVSAARLDRRLIASLIAGGWGLFHAQDSTSSALIPDLLSNPDEQVLKAIAERLGATASGELGALLLVAEPQMGLSGKAAGVAEELSAGARIVWAPVGDSLFVLCESHVLEQLGRLAADALEQADASKSAVYGIGALSARIEEGWPRSLLEDLQYAAIVSSIPLAHRRLAHVDDLGHWRHYQRLPWTEATLVRAAPQVHRLMQRDNSDWVDTLEVFLDTNGDISECCERLHIHRTTLHYRIGRIREIVGDRLSSGSGRADLITGFAIASLMRRVSILGNPIL